MENFKLQNWREVAKIYTFLLAVGGISFGVSLFSNINICLFYVVTGIPFFSCGMGRAFGSLLGGVPGIGQAFFYHPLFFTVPFIPLVGFLKARPRMIATIVIVAMFVLLWVVRMFMFFPHTAPMDFNDGSLAAFIFRWFAGGQ